MHQLTRLWVQIETLDRLDDVKEVSVAMPEQLSRVVDPINRELGRDSVTAGLLELKLQPHTGAKISFNRVPEKWEFDERKSTPDQLLARLNARKQRVVKAKERGVVPRAPK